MSPLSPRCASALADPPGTLPLELFDNTEYECRPIPEWLAMAEEHSDGSRYLPALFLRPPVEAGLPALWTECDVQDYDEATSRFTVHYKGAIGAASVTATSVTRSECPARPAEPARAARPMRPTSARAAPLSGARRTRLPPPRVPPKL